MYGIIITTQDRAIKVVVPKGKSVNIKVNRTNVLRKLNKYYQNKDPKQVWPMSECYLTTRRYTRHM
jgi:hypothetical protein